MLARLAHLTVGMFTWILIPPVLFAAGAPVGPLIGAWCLMVGIGLALSAPWYLGPADRYGGGSVRLPAILWLVFLVFKIINVTGYYLLRLLWWLIFLFFRTKPANAPGYGRVISSDHTAADLPAFPAAGAMSGPPAMPTGNTGQQWSRNVAVPGPAGSARAGGLYDTPPSWRRDPTGRYVQRYWDGTKWTPHVQSGTATGYDPM
jgi:hypothetical protein